MYKNGQYSWLLVWYSNYFKHVKVEGRGSIHLQSYSSVEGTLYIESTRGRKNQLIHHECEDSGTFDIERMMLAILFYVTGTILFTEF